MKKKLFILVGCAGTGKSTWVKNHIRTLEGTSAAVSRDAIRFSLVGEDEEYFSKETQVFHQYVKELKDSLYLNDNTIADATQINEMSRNKLLRALGSSLKDVEINAIVFKNDLDTIKAQNEERKGTRAYVPVEQIKRMYTQLTVPTFEEGFDKIYFYNPKKTNIKYTIIEKEKK